MVLIILVQAAELAMKFVPDRARAVVSAVCDRLSQVNRPEPVGIGMVVLYDFVIR
jgi:hypothetical protein